MFLMVVLVLLITIGAIFVLQMNKNTREQYRLTLQDSNHKQDIIRNIEVHTNGIFYRVRGYFAYQDKQEYDRIYSERDKLKKSIDQFKQYPLKDSELAFVSSIELFVNTYFANTLEQSIRYMEDEDWANLRKLSVGTNTMIDDMLVEAENFRSDGRKLLNQQSEKMLDDLASQELWFIVYILFILLVAMWVTFKSTRDIGHPLAALSTNAEDFARGNYTNLAGVSRKDEIGMLAKSMNYMMTTIQSKEEELVAQNEELQAQQDELQMQQEELQQAMSKMEDNEQYLERRNLLIQSLMNTLDQQELLESIARNLVEVTQADKGMIVLLNRERNYAAFGISEQGIQQCMDELEDSILVRVIQTKEAYSVTRESKSNEKGYHLESSRTSDLYVPILNADGVVIACAMLTHIGKQMTKQAEVETMSLATQVSLSLEKLEMYKATEQQRQMTRDMLNTIQEGVQLVDKEGSVLHINTKLCDLFGCDDEHKAAGISLEKFFEEKSYRLKDSGKLMNFISTIYDEQEMNARSAIYEMIEPEKRVLQVYYEPLYRAGKRFGTVIVHRDITKEYEVDQMKSEFVSTVSHELRTPLASVLGFTELLLYKELKPERQHKYLTMIHQEATRLTALINDFLDLQRMESGKQAYDLQKVDLFPIIEEIIEFYKINYTKHVFEISRDTPHTYVLGDKDKLKQVFMNLLSNAVKYSPEGGRIKLICKQQDHQLIVDIADEGLGIPQDAIPHLFTKFYRIDNTDRRQIGGTGLGLAIVSEIMHAHNGHIEVKSVFGRGSTFSLIFPLLTLDYTLAPITELTKVAGDTYLIASKNPTIMIVEDDLSLTELLTAELQDNGFQVVHFTNGKEAIEAAVNIKPDAIVVDILLKNSIDGWEIIREMKRHEVLSQVPIFISSALEEKEEKDKGVELGARGYLVKPYHPHKLSQIIFQTLLDIEN